MGTTLDGRGDGALAGEMSGPLRTLFASGTAVGRTDGQLLDRFHDRGDAGAEPAFAALVERHGPMVLRACRGVLRDEHAAMDAFQATFLVLARKAGSLRDGGSLAPWLHRVALRAAGRARRDASKRRAIELRASLAAGPQSINHDSGELLAAIHIEVDRLPDRYRSAVVLCVLEGLSCEQAAGRLGCPIGTVASRLARGRQRLRDALHRRGLAPSAVAFVRVLPDVSIPPTLVASTAAAAVRFVTIRTVGAATSLALEVLRSMTLIRIGQATLLLVALGASASGVASFAGKEPAEAEPPTVARPEAAPGRYRVERRKLEFDVEGGAAWSGQRERTA